MPRDRRVWLERRGGLIPAGVREVSVLEAVILAPPNAWLQLANAHRGPPPAYTREPAAPRPVSGLTRRDPEQPFTTSFRALGYLGPTTLEFFTQSR